MAKIVKEFILVGWYSGIPVTRHGCYETTMEKCVIVGRNIYSTETKPFNGWLESLHENALYRRYLERILRLVCKTLFIFWLLEKYCNGFAVVRFSCAVSANLSHLHAMPSVEFALQCFC